MRKQRSAQSEASIPTAGWSELDQRARVFRLLHASIALVELSSLGYIWFCAVTRRRDRLLAASLMILSAQGMGLVIGRGNCPLGPLQRQMGDPVPLFELVLSRRAAKAAVPTLTALTFAGLLAIALRRPHKKR